MSEQNLTASTDRGNGRGYVLMTAAYNEEAHIARTIESVISQSVLPQRWVIVSDASSDRTDEIIANYARQCPLICFLRVSRPPGRSFRSKVIALRAGGRLLEGGSGEFIGNVDADVSLGPAYFADLIGHFEQNPKLGLAAGFVCEQSNGHFSVRRSNRLDSVAHAAQLMRRKCYEAIGGYAVLKYGGEDWHAQTSVRMMGWEAQAFPDLHILHHRRTGAGDYMLRDRFRLGRLDYSFGSYPVFEIFKCLLRVPEEPFLIGGATRLAGFAWSSMCREDRPVPAEFIAFLRSEQKTKLAAMFSRANQSPKSSRDIRTW